MSRLAIILILLYQVSFLLHMDAHEHEADHGTDTCAACTQYEEDEFDVVPVRYDAALTHPAAFKDIAVKQQRSQRFAPAYRTRAPPHF